jgi:hypothetical protein
MTKAAKSDASELYSWAWISVAVYAIITLMYYSYDIRLTAIKEYGPVIHEFDPYFNFRATQVSESSSDNACFLCSLLKISVLISVLIAILSTCMNTAPQNSFSGMIQWYGIPWEDP